MRKFFVFFMILFTLSACGRESGIVTYKDDTGDSNLNENALVSIYICGAVNKPGVYKVSKGSIVDDVLKAAGGLTDDAAKDMVNLAKSVSDGDMIYFPYESEKDDYKNNPDFARGRDSSKSDDEKESGGLVNINTATKDELTTLPGIGDAKAESIISYREANGAFSSCEDIKNVSGIGDKLYDRIKDYISVG